MYGIVEISGHQYKVKPGDLIDVDKLTAEAGKEVEFDKVLFIGGAAPALGKPTVAGAKVTAHVIKHDRDAKQIIFKKRPGDYKKKNGFRKTFTALLITELNSGAKTEKIAADHRWAKKFLGK